jgi:hypothetical protein
MTSKDDIKGLVSLSSFVHVSTSLFTKKCTAQIRSNTGFKKIILICYGYTLCPLILAIRYRYYQDLIHL